LDRRLPFIWERQDEVTVRKPDSPLIKHQITSIRTKLIDGEPKWFVGLVIMGSWKRRHIEGSHMLKKSICTTSVSKSRQVFAGKWRSDPRRNRLSVPAPEQRLVQCLLGSVMRNFHRGMLCHRGFYFKSG